jgi:hypothetical protein
MKYLFLTAALAVSMNTFAQTVSGYIEAYYSYDVNKPLNNTKAPFLYTYTRNNEVNINLGYIKVNYNNDWIRTNLAIATGTYMNANYTAEQGVLKNIYEANVGVKLSRKHSLWLDAGVLPSHIGWEGATGKDYPTLSRSLAAENSPYFETGVRAGYTSANGKWYLSALILNGWQRIQRVDGNTTPAFGTQLTFKPNAAITLNSSTFIGNDKPDSVRQMRYFHDLYGTFNVTDQWSFIAGFDIGWEQKAKGSSVMNNWYTPAVIVRYAPGKCSVSARGEYYDDKNGVIVGAKLWGYSANLDYKINDYATWRFEVRNLSSKEAIFQKQNIEMQKNSLVFTTAIAVGF